MSVQSPSPSPFQWLDGTKWKILDFDGTQTKVRNPATEWGFTADCHVNDAHFWTVGWQKKTDDRITMTPVDGTEYDVIFINRKNFFVTRPAFSGKSCWVHKGEIIE